MTQAHEAARPALEKLCPFVARSGLQVIEMQRGYTKCLMPFAGNGNHVGIMYAGALFTLAEFPGGILFVTSFDAMRYFPIVKSLDLRFLRPAYGDVTVEMRLSEARIVAVTAEADEKGKADFILEGELKSADGALVATSHGVYQLRSQHHGFSKKV